MSRSATKQTKWHVCPKKTQISLDNRQVWSVFAVLLEIVWVLNYLLSAQQRLWSDLADAQADLSLRWALMLFCRICHAPTSIYRIACWTRFGLVMLAWPGSNYRNTQLVRKPLTQPFPFGNHGHQLYRKKLFIIRARAVLKNITTA